MSSVGYREPVDQLSDEGRDMHRAIELEDYLFSDRSIAHDCR